MILNQTTLREYFVGLNAAYQQGYRDLIKMGEDWKQVAMVLPSSTKENLYGWLQRWPKVREWVGDRHLKNLALNGYRLANRKWEDSIQIPRDDFDDDQQGMYTVTVREGWADARLKFMNNQVFGLMINGTTNPCFDGTAFFNANHPQTSSANVTTLQSNVIAGAGQPWYLLDTRGNMKPFLVQERRPFEFKALMDLNDSQVFMRDEFLFGIDARYGFGYGFWQRALRSQAALSNTTLDSGIQQMMSLVDEEGEALGVVPNLLVCGPSNRAAALQSVKTSLLPWPTSVTGSGTNTVGGNTNYNQDVVQLAVVPWLP
jgi:phage major head subunit gpT-like protein